MSVPSLHDRSLRLTEGLARLGSEEQARRQARLDHAVTAQNLILDGTAAAHAAWRLDLTPELLDRETFDHLAAGFQQRLTATEAYVQDLYGEQAVLRDRQIPADLALGDPGFHRQLTGLPAPRGHLYALAAIDLLEGPDGAWRVLEHQFATPVGFALLLQHRRLLAQVVPELFVGQGVAPIAGYGARLGEHLRAVAEAPRPLTVLLGRATEPRDAFEESFLARSLGIARAQPADLVVRSEGVFLRTIRGLVPIDVMLRRLPTSVVDPLVFSSTGLVGVPGLVHAARRGQIQIVNALGAGVSDNRALLRHFDTLIRYYQREDPLLGNVPTFWLGDADQRRHVLSQPGAYMLRPLYRGSVLGPRLPKPFRHGEAEAAEGMIKTHPELVVAHPREALTGPDGQPARLLRLFAVPGDDRRVVPGALAARMLLPNRSGLADQPSNTFYDTWVPARAGRATAPRPLDRLEAELVPSPTPLASRIAESFYWLGRYLERADLLARMLGLLEGVRAEEFGPADAEATRPLWVAVAAAAGHDSTPHRDGTTGDLDALSTRLLLDPTDPSSVAACLLAAENNSAALRGVLTPECWGALQDLAQLLTGAAAAGPAERRQLATAVVDAQARFAATAERTLLHDSGLAFLRVGRHLERAVATTILLEQVLVAAAPRQLEHRLDDTELIAILRLFGALDAYRRIFRARPFLDRLAYLLWQRTDCPASLANSLAALRRDLGEIAEVGPSESGLLLQELDALTGAVAGLAIAEVFPFRTRSLNGPPSAAKRVGAGLTARQIKRFSRQLKDGLEELHPRLEDLFFSHLDRAASTQLELAERPADPA